MPSKPALKRILGTMNSTTFDGGKNWLGDKVKRARLSEMIEKIYKEKSNVHRQAPIAISIVKIVGIPKMLYM